VFPKLIDVSWNIPVNEPLEIIVAIPSIGWKVTPLSAAQCCPTSLTVMLSTLPTKSTFPVIPKLSVAVVVDV